MKRLLSIFILLCFFSVYSQTDDQQRIQQLKNKLEILSTEVSGLNEVFQTEIKATNLTLSNLLLAVADVHKLNINPSQSLNSQTISPNFPSVLVSDLLIFLCKEYSLTIDITGTIMSVKQYEILPTQPEKRIIPVTYDPDNNLVSIDAQGDKLYDVFRRIMDESGKNLVFSQGLENKNLTSYIQDLNFDVAMKNLAFANNLLVEQSKDGFYIFQDDNAELNSNTNQTSNQTRQRPFRQLNSNFYFKVIDSQTQLLEVDFQDTPIADIINGLCNELKIDFFTATPLTSAGTATFKAKSISFDELLTNIFEKQTIEEITNYNNTNSNSPSRMERFSFKKEGTIYFFGLENQLSVREVAIITLQHRSVELLSDPSGGFSNRSAGRSINSGFVSNNTFNNRNFNQTDNFNTNSNRQPINTNRNDNFSSFASQAEALVNILPLEVKQNLNITVDYELNSFYVNGPSANIERFKRFINKIDQPVPVVLIEVMILEVSKTSSVETGVSWGIGEEPTTTKGGIFPETNLTLGANTINRVIGGFDGFGTFNLGKVVPNFYATIKAMERSGDLKIKSTPKLSTLNGHRATFSNGQTSYYTITDQSIIGSNNPITQTAINFVPIDAELGITIKPMVSGDGQVTLDIFVVQSNFGNRISEDAPPDINSREFSSIIRIKDQDIVVLGGLEEQSTNNSGSGVPFLARIPVIKWLFSQRVREGRKAKLTVLIKPTVIY
jgi:type IV pilus assembly protein PilQ